MSKICVVLAALGITGAGLIAQRAPVAPKTNQYVSAAVCATCHSQIAATYRKTGMGRSFYRLEPANAVEDFGKPFYHAASDSYFLMFLRDGKYYQRRWQKGSDGRETNVDEKQVDYVLGSGNHSRTYLHMAGDHTLQELPLSWYSENGGYWGMSPGFDRPDYPGSTRVVTYECMFCHNAYPGIPKNHDEVGAKPEFLQPLPESIDCQRCHGPGQKHVSAASRAGATAAEIRASIVNPKRLSSERQMEVCMQCHLETTSISLPHDIRRFDRAPYSYVPGQPLGDFRPTFDRAGGMGERFEIAGAAYRLRESQCFLQSKGALQCTTCHDPHNVPRGAEATAHYNGVCRDCHAAAFTKTVVAGAHTANTDCISCHMPKRRTDDAVHVVMTDHLIRRTQPAGDLLAAKPEIEETAATSYKGNVVPYYPKSLAATTTPAPDREAEAALYLAAAQIQEASNLKEGLPDLQRLLEKYRPRQAGFYADLGEGFNATGERKKAVQYFDEAVRHAPGSAIILRKLGSAQMEAGQTAEAEATLRRVAAMTADDAATWAMLGQVLWREGKNAEAKAAFLKSAAANPEVPEVHNSLATLLLADGDGAGAEKEFREALRIQPGSAAVQANLASVLASRGETTEAREHFERSLALKPDFVDARLNYARMLGSIGETDNAAIQAQAAVTADASVAAAHEMWGSLLGTKGDLSGATRELQAAVKLQPDFWRAQFELGVLLGRSRDYAGAEEHLRIAAGGSDAKVKAAAVELLQQLGK